ARRRARDLADGLSCKGNADETFVRVLPGRRRRNDRPSRQRPPSDPGRPLQQDTASGSRRHELLETPWRRDDRAPTPGGERDDADIAPSPRREQPAPSFVAEQGGGRISAEWGTPRLASEVPAVPTPTENV